MQSKELVSLGLGLEDPWFVSDVKIEKDGSELVLHIEVDHKQGSSFAYEGDLCSVYDHHQRSWEHLNFFEHRCILHARVPRIKTKSGSVRLVEVPWAHQGSSFTLKYELHVLQLIQEGMSASAAARYVRINPKRVFRIIKRHVIDGLIDTELDTVTHLALDETSSKKGHNYLTIIADRERKKVVGVSEGRSSMSMLEALEEMEFRGASASDVKSVTMDMSPSYIKGASEHLQEATIIFDRFHIQKQMNEALDEIRRAERKKFTELKRSRYLWLRNNSNLTDHQRKQVSELSRVCPNTGAAYRLKELLKIVLDEAYITKKVTPLNEWIKEAWSSNLEPVRKFVNMLRRHWYGVKSYFYHLATNAYAERVNLKIQEIKRIAKGYRSMENYKIMIYFHLGGLNLVPTING